MIPLQFAVPGGPELLVFCPIATVYLIVPSVLAYWVSTDTESRGDENAAFWAVAVGGLAFMTFFGGILASVVYLWDRDWSTHGYRWCRSVVASLE